MKVALTVILWLGWSLGTHAARGLPPQEGILNFGKVSEILFRGAQPDAAAINRLKELGIKSIINLREHDKSWELEAEQARASGLLCTNIPMRGVGRPTAEVVSQVLAAIESMPGPVFIHCRHGCDRTGTIVACYRIRQHKWSTDEALKEANRYGLSRFERGMKRFVLDFGKAALTP